MFQPTEERLVSAEKHEYPLRSPRLPFPYRTYTEPST